MEIKSVTEYYKGELSDSSTNYFILDAAGEAHSHEDIDFVKYGYSTKQFNKIKAGDLFIYRRPNRGSVNSKFYFFGSGKVRAIASIKKNDETYNDINASILIEKPLPFTEYLYAKDLENYEWKWKQRGRNWSYFFNQYGMNAITKEDFVVIAEMGFPQDAHTSNGTNEINLEVYLSEKFQNEDYSVPDIFQNVKTRGKAQQLFSKKLREIYNNTCCITGIATQRILSASHIIPWSKDKSIRLDPKNGILLSPLMDKLFDLNFIAIDVTYRVVLSDKVKADPALFALMSAYEGKRVRLPTANQFWPKTDYLLIHMQQLQK